MSLLSVVQAVCPRLGLPAPTIVIGSTDPQIVQLQGFLEELGQSLAADYKWQQLRRRTTWVSSAGEDQGSLASRTGADFKGIVNATFWNNTLRRPVFGPIDDQDWQALKAFQPGGPVYQYRIENDRILINPAAAPGETYTFIWESRYWILDNDGTTRKEAFTEDTDTLLLLPEVTWQVGLQARWKEEKGLPYAELKARYNDAVETYKMKDGTKRVLQLDQPSHRLQPGIFVPSGNWPV